MEKRVYTTTELEKYVKNQIEEKLDNVDWKNIKFEEGSNNSVEGTYIFTKEKKYHILFAEKGRIREDKITTDEKVVITSVLGIISFDIAMNFAINNREKNKDFRRKLFEKEVEIYALFGEEFRNAKKREIDLILKENPFNDI